MAAMMAIFMLSLGGLPMTGGFIGKYFLFGGLIQRGAADGKNWYYWLAGWAILNTVVSFYYYVRFIKVMYLGDRIADNKPLALSPALADSAGRFGDRHHRDRNLSAAIHCTRAETDRAHRFVRRDCAEVIPCISTTSSQQSPAGLVFNRY